MYNLYLYVLIIEVLICFVTTVRVLFHCMCLNIVFNIISSVLTLLDMSVLLF